MKQLIGLIQFLLLITIAVQSQSELTSELISNVYNRETTSLNGDWKYIVDPYENGYYNYRYQPFDQQTHPWASAFFLNSKPKDKSDLLEYDFDQMETLQVPGDWNSQKTELLYYEGTVWYKKSFDYSLSEKSNRVFLYFEAANYKAEVYLNGKKLGTHIGGFTPFNFEVSEVIKEKDNFLIVKVDNKRTKEGVPTLNTDWWNYGGLTRGVKLVEIPSNFIHDYAIHLDQNDRNKISGHIQINGAGINNKKIKLSIPELDISEDLTTDASGTAQINLTVKDLNYWSPDNPYLYRVQMQLGTDVIKDQIGFRSITTKGSQILLNDKPIFLKGISIHEENPLECRRAHSEEDAELLLDWAMELGCNYVRLAHYPHNEHMVRLADKKGILVWEETPVYWTIDWANPDTYANAENQLTELIARDQNRASVIIWSMANETPNSPERNIFLGKLAAKARAQDPTRLISAALEQKNHNGDPFMRTIDDPFANVVDILSFNEYIGWYDGLPEKCASISWEITQNKPVIVSEFGAGAKLGLHGEKAERWTEEFQEDLYVRTLEMLSKVEKLSGLSPWILADFRSPRRVLPKVQDGWNRKGLLSEKGEKKKAYYILQEYYEGK